MKVFDSWISLKNVLLKSNGVIILLIWLVFMFSVERSHNMKSSQASVVSDNMDTVSQTAVVFSLIGFLAFAVND